jgi:hypothetical protein
MCFTFSASTVAQAPSVAQGARDIPSVQRAFPVPRNLKVLSRDLTGQQVYDIMEDWDRSLGVRCDSCHAQATETTVADDESLLNYSDDAKPMKSVARTMYRMTEDINENYLARIDNSGVPMTCGTCHRGHVAAEPYFAPPNDGPPQPRVTPPGCEKTTSQ